MPKSERKIYSAFYTFLEYSFFTLIFWLSLKNNLVKKVIVGASIGFFLFQIIYFIYGTPNRIDSIPIGVETILILTFIVFYFFEQINSPKSQYIYENYFFWLVLGIIIYLAGSFFVYILAPNLSREELEQYWLITYIVEIIKNILWGLSIYFFARNQNNKTNLKNKSIPFLDIT